jgi:hypothetical protein
MTVPCGRTVTAGELMKQARERPPEIVIDGLAYVGDVVLLHGPEESFKSVFILQFAEAVSAGIPLFDRWRVPVARTVGVLETEIHPVMLGQRLIGMFPDGSNPDRLLFMSEEGVKQVRRAKDIKAKLQVVGAWVRDVGVQVLIIDTANDFFRGDDNPSDEANVGTFFDELRNMPLQLRFLVRHDRKHKGDDSFIPHSNELIRGSAEWKEDPELILHIKRQDKRTHEAELDVGKMRYGRKPNPFQLWFDAGTFRLTALPPVIAMLREGPMTRAQLLEAFHRRFGLAQRRADDLIAKEKNYLNEMQRGHQKVFEIDLARAAEAEWAIFMGIPRAGGELYNLAEDPLSDGKKPGEMSMEH